MNPNVQGKPYNHQVQHSLRIHSLWNYFLKHLNLQSKKKLFYLFTLFKYFIFYQTVLGYPLFSYFFSKCNLFLIWREKEEKKKEIWQHILQVYAKDFFFLPSFKSHCRNKLTWVIWRFVITFCQWRIFFIMCRMFWNR